MMEISVAGVIVGALIGGAFAFLGFRNNKKKGVASTREQTLLLVLTPLAGAIIGFFVPIIVVIVLIGFAILIGVQLIFGEF